MRASATRFACVIALLLVVSYAFFTLRGPRGLRGLVEKRQEIERMEKRNAALAQEIERKRARIRRLGENADEQEQEIRKRYKLAHPDEKVYILGEPQKK